MSNLSPRLHRWLDTLVRHSGSDLFLVVGQPPALRIAGSVSRLDEEPLESGVLEDAVLSALSPQALEKYRIAGYADSSLRLEKLGRFRINVHHERGRPAG